MARRDRPRSALTGKELFADQRRGSGCVMVSLKIGSLRSAGASIRTRAKLSVSWSARGRPRIDGVSNLAPLGPFTEANRSS